MNIIRNLDKMNIKIITIIIICNHNNYLIKIIMHTILAKDFLLINNLSHNSNLEIEKIITAIKTYEN